ncbi:MAG: hypothetical protein FJ087_23695, partial [Deltaproteobacteria bacterium]|nr:hypothetical protein [Deltaproteobacteria bacterium]
MRWGLSLAAFPAAAAAVWLVACGGGTTPPGGRQDVPGSADSQGGDADDVLLDDAESPGDDVEDHGPQADADPDPDATEAGEPGPDTPPNEGGFGWPCKANSECDYGFCVATVAGKVCTISCTESCPDTAWTCEWVTPPGQEALYACMPPETSLCRPCATDSDCVAGDEPSHCVHYGAQGWFCGTACGGDGDEPCRDGYECAELPGAGGGANVKACRAAGGDCPCLIGYVGLATQCSLANDYGTCLGQRKCVVAGDDLAWETCTAKPAEPEVCNGLDDDCDGLADDGLGEEPCGKGVCFRVLATCVDGKPQSCDPYKGSAAEVCNGLDDDCDGNTDELWPDKGKDCDGSDADACANGKLACAEGGDALACVGDDAAFSEACNGADDDCDGLTDEVEDLGETECGLGVCKHSSPNCVGGQTQVCNPMQGAADDDVPDPDFTDTDCDGIDGDVHDAVFVDWATGKDLG